MLEVRIGVEGVGEWGATERNGTREIYMMTLLNF